MAQAVQVLEHERCALTLVETLESKLNLGCEVSLLVLVVAGGNRLGIDVADLGTPPAAAQVVKTGKSSYAVQPRPQSKFLALLGDLAESLEEDLLRYILSFLRVVHHAKHEVVHGRSVRLKQNFKRLDFTFSQPLSEQFLVGKIGKRSAGGVG